MVQEIGTAYVTIQPSTRGMAKGIEGEIDGAVDRGTKKGGSKLLSGFAKWGKRATILGAGVVAALTIKGGVGRLMQLEDATQSLKGLGYTAEEIAGITDNALAAVRGTAFGIGDAANVAAGALGAGVKEGKELERFLTLTADAAAQARVDLGSMGQMMNRVRGDGRLMGDTVAQMAKNGLYVLPMLAEEFGVTQQEMRKMVSAGQVDAETFERVLEKNIGGSALRMGETVKGSFANLKASLGRVGAFLVGPIFTRLPKLFQRVTASLGGFEDRAKAVGEAMDEWMRTDGAAMFERIKSAVRSTLPTLRIFASAVGVAIGFLVDNKEAVGAFVAVLAGFAAVVKTVAAVTKVWTAATALLNAVLAVNPIALVAIGLAALVAGLVLAWQHSETFRNVVTGAWNGIKSAAQDVVGWYQSNLAPAFAATADFVTIAVQRIGEVFAEAWSRISAVWDVVGVPMMTAMKLSWLQFKLFWSVTWEVISAAVKGAWATIRNIIDTRLRVITGLLRAATAILKGDWSGAWNAMKSVLSAVWSGITAMIRIQINIVMNLIKGIGPRILSYVSGFGSLLYDAGRKLIGGLIRGIKSMFGEVKDALGDLTGKLTSWKGPEETDRRLLIPAGRLIIEGLVTGLESKYDAVRHSLRGFTADLGVSFAAPEGAAAGMDADTLYGVVRAGMRDGAREGFVERGRRYVADSRRGLAVGGI